MGHALKMWSAVRSMAPYSQLGEEARHHLCINEWNRSTPVRRRLSLTQAVWGTHFNRHGTGPGYVNTDPGCILAVFYVPSIICPLKTADAKSGKVFEDSAQLAQTSV